jgi:hypothetical protein
MEATTEESADRQELHPLDDPPTEPTQPIQREGSDTVAEPRRRRGLGANRHFGSLVLSFLGVLGGYAALDYAYYRTLGAGMSAYQGGELPDNVLIVAGIAAGCFFLAAAAGRISAVGPLLAGLVLGVGPCVWLVLDPQSFIDRANDVPELWNHTSFGLVGAAAVIYPTVAGLMIGAAFAGRWRRARVTT